MLEIECISELFYADIIVYLLKHFYIFSVSYFIPKQYHLV